MCVKVWTEWKMVVFLWGNGHYTTFIIVNIRKMWEKKGKIRRTKSMTKKSHQKFLPWEWNIFPEIGPRKNFLVPSKFGARSPPMRLSKIYSDGKDSNAITVKSENVRVEKHLMLYKRVLIHTKTQSTSVLTHRPTCSIG